jgi:hypothetical protein
VQCERDVYDSYHHLSLMFNRLSDLEQNSAVGHVSTGFDTMSCGSCLSRYSNLMAHSLSQQYQNVFIHLRLLARYRDSIKNTILQRDGFKSSLISKQNHLRYYDECAQKSVLFWLD